MVRVWISETSRTTKRKVTMVIIPRSTTNFLVHKTAQRYVKKSQKKFPFFVFNISIDVTALQILLWQIGFLLTKATSQLLHQSAWFNPFTMKNVLKNVSITKNSSRPPHHNVLKKLQKVSFYNIFPPKIKVTFLARKFKVTKQRTFWIVTKFWSFFFEYLVQNFNFEKND